MLALGIETSCDETAAALVDGQGLILAERILSQLDEHRPFGGVVPEVAARAHLEHLDRLIGQTMQAAGKEFADLDLVAATCGPGLIGGVFVGAMTGKAIALAANKPFIAVNHLEGHALSARLGTSLPFPYLLLLASGGHCQLLAVEGVGHYRKLGGTIDDAAGEAFDKTAKLLDLGYPGGPAVERAALAGDPSSFAFPRPMKGRPGCDFSFSGLKTAVRLAAEQASELTPRVRADIAASFQQAVAEVMADRAEHAIALTPQARHLVVAGGVAANQAIKARLLALAEKHGLTFMAPPLKLCTDNAAMIAWAGIERFRLGQRDSLDFAPRPRWPLEEMKAL
ncbi:MAG: tRNA (adenosine(37)-N6)-threonylcarbamoyltransferase complex transferase subunit TsaD [Alphaproteobacteria bacterium]|nr:tRNA (adenosine(37)-N6)-threonylcarbamoyltransferase complex transferase subunit TsaD [Alphaproteobacteria bacterium]